MPLDVLISYTMQDLLFGVGGSEAAPNGGVVGKLGYRQDVFEKGGLVKLMDGILELSRNYRFPKLEQTGPVVSLTPGVSQYPSSAFTNGQYDTVNLIPSFYMNYYNVGYAAGNGNGQSGTQLTWKSIDSLELMMGIAPGTPSFFSRYNDFIYIAPTPSVANTAYLRYQIEHPFTKGGALTDPFYLPNDWREIAEYAGALRFSIDTAMLDYASQFRTILYGDPQGKGDIGLITRKISQNEGDITANTAMRSMRVRVSKY